MGWLPANSDFLTVFGAVVAAGTALIGIFAGLSQFTGTSGARRTAEWTTDALDKEQDPARRLVLERLKLRALGHLVAARYVPWWRLYEVALQALFTPVFIALNLSLWSVLAAWVNLSAAVRRAIRIYSERLRVARQFVKGGRDVEPVRVDLLNQMEGGTRTEFTLGYLAAAAYIGTAALAALALRQHGAPPSRWLWTILGICVCLGFVWKIRAYAASWAERATSSQQPTPPQEHQP